MDLVSANDSGKVTGTEWPGIMVSHATDATGL